MLQTGTENTSGVWNNSPPKHKSTPTNKTQVRTYLRIYLKITCYYFILFFAFYRDFVLVRHIRRLQTYWASWKAESRPWTLTLERYFFHKYSHLRCSRGYNQCYQFKSYRVVYLHLLRCHHHQIYATPAKFDHSWIRTVERKPSESENGDGHR